jgi:hypothetical protein
MKILLFITMVKCSYCRLFNTINCCGHTVWLWLVTKEKRLWVSGSFVAYVTTPYQLLRFQSITWDVRNKRIYEQWIWKNGKDKVAVY